MILLLIALISLSAIYFIRLLSKKDMKAAAISVAVLYINIIVWTYAILVLDVANLGFSDAETRLSLIQGSDIYHSFVSITDKMSVIPFELLEAIVAVAILVLLTAFTVAFHGLFEIARSVARISQEKMIFYKAESKTQTRIQPFNSYKPVRIIKIYCRMNC